MYNPPHSRLGFPDKSHFVGAVLQWQYLPNVRADGSELPPLFSTATLTEETANALSQIRKKDNFGWVESFSRRYDGLIRSMGLPHPVPYSSLVVHMRDNWGRVAQSLIGERSIIGPASHKDGRIIRMDYELKEERLETEIRMSQAARYLVEADIGSCFSSIYSHAIDWALRGKVKAKKGGRSAWPAQLDRFVRRCMHGETKGLHIGPALSNIVAEIILQDVDSSLRRFDFVRYVDDYQAFFSSREDAEDFLGALQQHLRDYRLSLNNRKTRIVNIEKGFGESWIYDLRSALPRAGSGPMMVEYLRKVEEVARQNPGASVLKYGAKALVASIGSDEGLHPIALGELARIGRFNPQLLPTISGAISGMSQSSVLSCSSWIAESLTGQLPRAIAMGETDTILWILYIAYRQLGSRVASDDLRSILELGDDFVLVALMELDSSLSGDIANAVRGYTYSDEVDREGRWLVRYELFRRGLLGSSDMSEKELAWMSVMRRRRVRFVR